MKRTLRDDDVASIRRIYENLDITQEELAKLWQTTQPHISRIIRGLRRKPLDKTASSVG